MTPPLCFVLMPFGRKPGAMVSTIDCEAVAVRTGADPFHEPVLPRALAVCRLHFGSAAIGGEDPDLLWTPRGR